MYLYLGDDNIDGAAGYLCGIMQQYDIPYERVDSDRNPPDDFCSTWYDAYILSDYRKERFRPGELEHLRDAVRQGSGLIMFGGWSSYHGRLGEYHDSVLSEVLPVEMLDRDDRRNFAQPVMVYRCQPHPILEDLPWEYPPFVGGFNQFTAKKDSHTLLRAICTRFRIVDEDQVAESSSVAVLERASIPLPNGSAVFVSLSATFPMLVVGEYGEGRTVALATDVAPHWVGGFVDWGKERIVQQLPNGDRVEVGADYARFFSRLLRWTGKSL